MRTIAATRRSFFVEGTSSGSIDLLAWKPEPDGVPLVHRRVNYLWIDSRRIRFLRWIAPLTRAANDKRRRHAKRPNGRGRGR